MGHVLERAWKIIEWLILIAAVIAATALSLTLHWLVYRELATTDRVRLIFGRPVTDADLYGYAAIVVGAVKIALLTAALNAWARARRVMACFLAGLFVLAFIESVVAVGGFFLSAQTQRSDPAAAYQERLTDWRTTDQRLAAELDAARAARDALAPTPITADIPAARVAAIQARDQAATAAADQRLAEARILLENHQRTRPAPPAQDVSATHVEHPLYALLGAWTSWGAQGAKLAFLALVALIIELTAAGGVYAIGASAPVWAREPIARARRASLGLMRALAGYLRAVWDVTTPQPAPEELYRALAGWAWRSAPEALYRALWGCMPQQAPEALYRSLWGWAPIDAPEALYRILTGWAERPMVVTPAESERAPEAAPNVVPMQERLEQIRERWAQIEAERAQIANDRAPEPIAERAPIDVTDELHQPVQLDLDDGIFGEVTIR